jgi:hypothetical protein
MFVLTFFSSVVVSAIAAVIDLETLVKIFPILTELFSRLTKAQVDFIQGVIPTALVSGWNSLLPTVLLLMCQAQGSVFINIQDLKLDLGLKNHYYQSNFNNI